LDFLNSDFLTTIFLAVRVMGLVRLAMPTQMLMSLAEVKARLRIDISEDDNGLERLIERATRLAESRTQRALLTQQWAFTASGFPNASKGIALPLPPLQRVDVISYINQNGVMQTLSSDDYLVDTTGLVGMITPAYGKAWPHIQRRANAVRVEFTCGCETVSDVEPDIVLAVLQLIAHFDVNRDSGDKSFENALSCVDSLLAPYAIQGV
jgi:uncharacterized phiE125 gp8 family phage protein